MKIFLKIILFFLLIIPASCFSQNSSFTISGYIIDDKSNTPVQGAHIKIKTEKKGTVSNQRGYYSIVLHNTPIELEISHINYEPKTIIISKEINSKKDILMSEKIYMLGDAVIKTNKPVNLVEKKFYDIHDYEFVDTNILVIAHRYKEIKNPWFVLFNPNGDTIITKHINIFGNFYKDCLDNL
ncbi:MAG: carboxypeptidase-like regulatory domain-containing protein, partial [Bacteroidota bacterium]